MLRHLPLVLGMVAAFATPFLLIPGPASNDPNAPVDVAALQQGASTRSSAHAKARPAGMRSNRSDHAISGREPTARPSPPAVSRVAPAARTMTRMVAFASSPFPYDGAEPQSNKPFLNIDKAGRKGRRTKSGRVYWADTTYSDQRVLLHIPKGFDSHRPGVMVVFFHGHGATLERDVLARQRVPDQISASGINAVLVAPQFAVDARDSSAGKLWKPGGARQFLDEVAERLAEMHGDAGSRQAFAKMPVVIVGYSGGYLPAAWALAEGGIEERMKGVVLLDGLYGELDKFATWIDGNDSAFFVSAYARSTSKGNAKLRRMLADRNIPYRKKLPEKLRPGSITFVAANVRHRSYVTRAWTENPISDLLGRMIDTAPRREEALSASLAPAFSR